MGGAVVTGIILKLGGKSMTRLDSSLIIHHRGQLKKDMPPAVHEELLRPTNIYECSSRQLLGVDVSVKQGNVQTKHLCSANLVSVNKCLI